MAHVRDISNKFCTNIEYGSDAWKEAWTAATVTMFTVLMGAIQSSEFSELSPQLVEMLSSEFMLLGYGDRFENIEGILGVE
jgi:hypothetical protein